MPKKNYVFYPLPLHDEPANPSKLLSDLGKSTRRGIKRCSKCGIYNGTRALNCKNKHCDAVLKECGAKHKSNLDAIKLVSGASRQVFSVRVRDSGPDCRGFVQLPLLESCSEAQEKVALCFVDSCQRLFDDSILQCHETEKKSVTSPTCIHIKSATKSVNVATPIEIKNCLLSSLNFHDDVKNKLWLLSTETEGALVQRISKTIMAVKCQVTPKHPLGYLHFTFYGNKGKTMYDKFYCSCTNFKGHSWLNDNNVEVSTEKCIHYYACIWAFASDIKFTEEFLDFLKTELCINKFPKKISNTDLLSKQLYANKLICNIKIKEAQRPFINSPNKRSKKNSKEPIRELPEFQALINFNDWFTSLIERINQALFYTQNQSKTINSYIPSSFFELIQNRLENSPVKTDSACVINKSQNISYLIFSIPYLKDVFKTQQLTLQPVKIFKLCHENADTVATATFLKVAMLDTDGNCVPFTINWTPNVMSVSKFGNLEVTFQVECCDLEEFRNGNIS